MNTIPTADGGLPGAYVAVRPYFASFPPFTRIYPHHNQVGLWFLQRLLEHALSLRGITWQTSYASGCLNDGLIVMRIDAPEATALTVLKAELEATNILSKCEAASFDFGDQIWRTFHKGHFVMFPTDFATLIDSVERDASKKLHLLNRWIVKPMVLLAKLYVRIRDAFRRRKPPAPPAR